MGRNTCFTIYGDATGGSTIDMIIGNAYNHDRIIDGYRNRIATRAVIKYMGVIKYTPQNSDAKIIPVHFCNDDDGEVEEEEEEVEDDGDDDDDTMVGVKLVFAVGFLLVPSF